MFSLAQRKAHPPPPVMCIFLTCAALLVMLMTLTKHAAQFHSVSKHQVRFLLTKLFKSHLERPLNQSYQQPPWHRDLAWGTRLGRYALGVACREGGEGGGRGGGYAVALDGP